HIQHPEHGRPHEHPSDHVHEHNHDHLQVHTHDYDNGHIHSHLPLTEGIKFSSLVTMGIAGGLIPCPDALGIIIIAIGLNRILLGLGLIVSFSFGLASVLILIGILLVRSRSLLERFEKIGGGWKTALPLVSAVIVTL